MSENKVISLLKKEIKNKMKPNKYHNYFRALFVYKTVSV